MERGWALWEHQDAQQSAPLRRPLGSQTCMPSKRAAYHGRRALQVAALSMEELEAVQGTLQFKHGLSMLCTPRGGRD